MKKFLTILLMLSLFLIPVVQSLESSSPTFSARFVMGSGSSSENFTAYNTSYIIGRNIIGNSSGEVFELGIGFEYVTSLLNIIVPKVIFDIFVFIIDEVGMEWGRFNFSG